jgi:hypothetical protein
MKKKLGSFVKRLMVFLCGLCENLCGPAEDSVYST